jgi:hypothetical protein
VVAIIVPRRRSAAFPLRFAVIVWIVLAARLLDNKRGIVVHDAVEFADCREPIVAIDHDNKRGSCEIHIGGTPVQMGGENRTIRLENPANFFLG